MTITEIKKLLDKWEREDFTGVITIYYIQGGIRGVRKEEEIKKKKEK